MKKSLYAAALGLSLLASGVSAQEICTPITPATDLFSMMSKGQMSVTGNSCTDIDFSTGQFSAMKIDGTLNFNNFAPANAGGFTAHGSLNFGMQFDAATSSASLTYNGGPVAYTIQGQKFNVTYNNLRVDVSVGASVNAVNSSGSVIVDGTEFPAGTWVWNFLF
ncbi:hypothetical protein [Chitinimonas lacunae]|uniref:Uncharacterized protein n=1 Tax=Chitinimonas lacunae TaxID=1963018 RepID=A0ABV8MQB5_9NEIS